MRMKMFFCHVTFTENKSQLHQISDENSNVGQQESDSNWYKETFEREVSKVCGV